MTKQRLGICRKYVLRAIHVLASVTGSPAMLAVTVGMLATGFHFDFSEDWWMWIDRAVYLASFWMIIVIQAASNKNTEAMHRKLDELIHVHDKARNELEGIEDRIEEDLTGWRRQPSQKGE